MERADAYAIAATLAPAKTKMDAMSADANHNNMQYLIHAECPKCGGDVYDTGLNLVEERGLPVFDLDQFSQYSMQCDNDVYREDVHGESETTLSKEEYDKLSAEEKEKYYLTSCDYRFGTGDIDIIGEDDL